MVDQTSRMNRPSAGTDPTSHILAFGQSLQMTQWLTPQELESYRAPLIAKLLRHARKNATYYQGKIDVDLSSPEHIKKNWRHLPIIARAEVAQHRFKFLSRNSVREGGPITAGETSGSTGVPLAFQKSTTLVIAATALTERMFGWWGVDGGKSFAQIATDKAGTAPPPQGLTTRGWHSSHPTGTKHFISIATDVDTHLTWLMARRADYLGAYPPILKELARAVLSRGIEMKLELIMSVATVLDDETRKLCQAAFGAKIADTYGALEAGHLAAQCRECGEYHVSAETNVFELLRDDGSAAEPGEIGRVVVTPLYNYAMPLIRYELGDMAEVGSASPSCGRGLPTIRRILGRARNMFRFRDGTTLWPIAAHFHLTEYIALKQFQVVQTDLDHIEIRYVPETAGRSIDLAALTERVRTVLRHPVEVEVCAVDQIERTQTGKYEDCVSLVGTQR